MGAVKINAADKYFSLCVRERAGWQCERCGGVPDRRGLHCSHFHGRGKWGTRFVPENGTALCMGCHLHFTAHPHLHHEWQRLRLGPHVFAALREMAEDTSRGRIAKREQKAIAKHFRAEHARMVAACGMGRVEFAGYH